MLDENEHSRKEDGRSLHRLLHKAEQQDATVVVDSAAFFSELPPEQAAPPRRPQQNTPRTTVSGGNGAYQPPKRGKILLIVQAILSVLALVQLWRTQMLPVLYLVILAALLLLLWLLHLRHRQQLPGSFDKGPELLWQVPIQKIHHRTDPIQEPIREAALLLQLLFQALHLYQQLSVLVFKPLPLLSLLQLFFCRGDFLLKPLIFFLQLLHFLFRRRTSDCCRLQFLYLFYGNAFHSSCQRFFWLYGLQIRLDLLNRL